MAKSNTTSIGINSELLDNMNYMDLKRNVVLRGMDFQEVIEGDIPKLSNWLIRNWFNDKVNQKLNDFDEWIEPKLNDPNLIHPSLRLGYMGDKEEESGKEKKLKVLKKPKTPKREKNDNGIFSGTKKAYTYELANKGKDKATVIKMVKKKFPEAKDKSVSIWFKKALREQ
jgi:hypothetical protein